MDGRASPEGRRIQTNGARNEKASRLSRAKHNQGKETKKRAERETEHSFEIPPSLLSHLGRLLTLPTIAAATARGRDQVGRAGPIPSPLQPR